MRIESFDHVALPTERPEELIAFYGRLGFEVPEPRAWRASGVPFFSIHFGRSKINFHAPEMWQNEAFTLRGPSARPGFVWTGSRAALDERIVAAGAEVIAGPVELEGARGRGTSVYLRDPDGNLLEFIRYEE